MRWMLSPIEFVWMILTCADALDAISAIATTIVFMSPQKKGGPERPAWKSSTRRYRLLALSLALRLLERIAAGVERRRDPAGRVFRHRERRTIVAARQCAGARPEERLRDVDVAIEQDADEAVTHLVPVLGTPDDLLRRIGVEAIGRGVVEVRDESQLRAFRKLHGLGVLIAHLPFEIETALQDRLLLFARREHLQFEVLAAKMHVRLRVDQTARRIERHFADHFRVAVTGGDR